MNEQTQNSMRLYEEAKAHLDKNLCENFEDGCAETVSNLILLALGPVIIATASTYMLLRTLCASSSFKEVGTFEALPGDIIISATGTSTISPPPFPHGHTGIVARYGILSNNSDNGLLQEKWNLDSWDDHYAVAGGYPTRVFRPL